MSKFALRALLANWQDATQHERKALERKVPGAFGKLQPVLKQLSTELESQVRQRTERARAVSARSEASKKAPLTSRSGVSTAAKSARSAPGTPQKHVANRTNNPSKRQVTPTRPKRQTAPNSPLSTPRAPFQERQHQPQPVPDDFEPWSRPPSPIHPPSELPTLELYTGRWLEASDDSLVISSLYDLEPLRHREAIDDDGEEASPEAQAIGVISELVQLRLQIDAATTHLAEAALLQQSALKAPSEEECHKGVAASAARVQTALRDLNAAKECTCVAETAAHKLFALLLALAPSSPATETASSCGPSDGAFSEDLEVSYNARDLQLLVVQGTPYQPSRPVTPPAAIHGEDYALADSSLYYSSARWSC